MVQFWSYAFCQPMFDLYADLGFKLEQYRSVNVIKNISKFMTGSKLCVELQFIFQLQKCAITVFVEIHKVVDIVGDIIPQKHIVQ